MGTLDCIVKEHCNLEKMLKGFMLDLRGSQYVVEKLLKNYTHFTVQ